MTARLPRDANHPQRDANAEDEAAGCSDDRDE
jgi:hypothetical protein